MITFDAQWVGEWEDLFVVNGLAGAKDGAEGDGEVAKEEAARWVREG